jgi:hypothetical protein
VIEESPAAECCNERRPRRRLLKHGDSAPFGAHFGDRNMRRSISKAIFVALVATVTALCSASPSSAFGSFHGGGFHGGLGGFHPAFGGFRPGFRPGFVGFHPGFGGRRFVFHRGFFRNGVFINGWWGPGVVTWGGYDGCWAYRPAYNAAGAYLGYGYIDLCD